jgi:hypothetical protein
LRTSAHNPQSSAPSPRSHPRSHVWVECMARRAAEKIVSNRGAALRSLFLQVGPPASPPFNSIADQVGPYLAAKFGSSRKKTNIRPAAENNVKGCEAYEGAARGIARGYPRRCVHL